MENLSAKWIGSFCKNLWRMIPGGVHISGLCFSIGLNDFEKYSSHIKNVRFIDILIIMIDFFFFNTW